MSMEKEQRLNYKSLIDFVSEYGNLVILGMKGTCKTTLLMNLARTLHKGSKTRVFLMETFPKFVNEFDSIPYIVMKDSDVVETEVFPCMEPQKPLLDKILTKILNIDKS